jgi:hypothetical protein
MELAVNNHPDKQVSTVDPDSRLMKTQGMTQAICYNKQSAVDTKYHLIVAHEVTNTRRFKNVSTELNLHVLAYNLKRTLNIFGAAKLMKEVMAA